MTGDRIGNIALASAVTWSLKRRNFLVMEQQSGPGGWDSFGNTSPPGEMAMLAWQQVARGADGISYFRWRTSVSGQEQYWHGILYHDGRPRRRYHEAAATGKAMADMSKHILGTEPVADVGILNNYDQIWATELQRQNGGDPVAFGGLMNDFAQSLSNMGVDFGVFSEADDLKAYKMLLCPPLYLGDPKFARKLAAYARAGGCVVLTARSGVKDLNNRCLYDPLPGPFAELAGVEVDEYDILPRNSGGLVELQTGVKIPAGRMREHLLPAGGTEVIGVHRVGYMEGWPAITRRAVGKGSVVYVGTLPHGDEWTPLLQILLSEVKVPYRTDIPAGVEIARRRGEGRELTFVLNHTGDMKVLELGDRRFRDLLGGRDATGFFELAPYAVAILDGRM
jgi:beta-galactosidase